MEAGRVCTGFSKPWVARYSAEGGNITYTGARVLARGVSVQIEPKSSDDNNFYADNQLAESASGIFTGGTLTLTVDGLFVESERFIQGLPEAGADGFIAYGDNQQTPYIGAGYIARYMSGGVTTYVPTIVVKTKFNAPTSAAATQEEEIDWQTQELTAAIMRGDDANHNWKYVGAEYSTEDEAETALKTKLGIVSYSVTQTLSNVASSFLGTSIEEGEALSATLTAATGYNFGTVSVTMGGEDVTATAYDSATHVVSIESVSGDVVIAAEAHKENTVTFSSDYGDILFDLYLNNESVAWSSASQNPEMTVKAGDVIKIFADCTATYNNGTDTETNRWDEYMGSKLGNGNTLTHTVTTSDIENAESIKLGFNGSSATKGGTGDGYYYIDSDLEFAITTET